MEDVEEQVQSQNDSSSKAKSIPWIELHSGESQAVACRVRIPVKEYPKFNFVGKLLGPKGYSLKRLQEETGTRMAILGRGSMKDRAKEEECRKEGGKYAHLNEELHVLVEVYADAVDAFNRMTIALTELKKFLVPINDFDEIRAQQFEEMMYIKGDTPPRGRGRGAGPPPRGGGRGSLLSAPARGSPAGRGGSAYPPRAASGRGTPAPRGGPPGRSTPGAPPSRGRPTAPGRPPVETYDYSYGSDSYAEPAAAYEESYDQSYGQSETEFYDYGHGAGASNSYNDGYGDAWGGQSAMKSPPVRSTRGTPRAHPYGGSRGGY